MARDEHNRDDLLAEATALVCRVSLAIPGRNEPMVIGFRRDRGVSFYFTTDRVYQFTSVGELRRAFVDGLLVKAERGRLVALRKQRTATAVALVRHELTPAETSALLAELRRHFQVLDEALTTANFQVVGQVPDGADVIGQIRSWRAAHSSSPAIAHSPRAR